MAFVFVTTRGEEYQIEYSITGDRDGASMLEWDFAGPTKMVPDLTDEADKKST